MEEKSPVVAAFLSLLFPGVGSLYAGRPYKGLSFMAIFLYIIHIVGRCTVSALFLVAFWAFSALEAYNDASGQVYSPSGNVGWGVFWILAGLLLQVWTLDIVEWSLISKLWPLLLISGGLYLIYLGLKNGGER